MEPTYLSKDEVFMHSLHSRIKELSTSLDSAISSWAYFKKQVLLGDLHTYACTALSYMPSFIPCPNATPDVLFVTQTENEYGLEIYSKVKRSMQAVTKNIHRTSISKAAHAGGANDFGTMLTVLASEIAILGPQAVFLFHGIAAKELCAKARLNPPRLFTIPYIEDTDRCRMAINESLQQLATYLATLKG